MNKIKEFYFKYEELINYLWVGILTTIVAWTAKFVGAIWLNADIPIQNFLLCSINWTAGVIFGYFANRKWVFKSKDPHILKEGAKFAGSRLSTYFLDLFINWIAINVLAEKCIYPKVPGETILFEIMGKSISCSKTVLIIATLISAVLVTIANYVLSKLLVFRKKGNKADKKEDEKTLSEEIKKDE